MTAMELKLPGVEIPDPDAAWAASGLMSLTGRADGPPLLAPPGVVVGLRRLAAAVGDASGVIVDGPALAGERAALAGLVRQGDVSCGGTTRLLQCTDGWLALTLARAADVELLPAWLEEDTSADDVAPRVAHRSAGTLMERAALLGLP
ncbi:MAG: CoA transferase, partial [Acidimicrobiia bacterium]